MPRSARSSAGRRVLDLAARYSERLLIEEVAAFQVIDRLTEELAAAGRSRANRRLAVLGDDFGKAALDAELRRQLVVLAQVVVRRVRPTVIELAVTSAGLSVLAIGRELDVCEGTLGKKYAGIAAEARDRAQTAASGLATGAISRYGAAESAVLYGWQTGLAQQLQYAAQYGETRAQVLARLFSPDPVRLRGCSGRGAFWSVASALQAMTRELSIGLGNRVREAGMSGFNAAHEAR